MIQEAVEHIPVLKQESLNFLQVRQGGTYLDCTAGLGGHSQAILDELGESGLLIALDRDPEAVERLQERLGHHRNLRLRQRDFREFGPLLDELGVQSLDGALADLGVSSLQLDSARRGFSFQRPGPLDMRMDPSGSIQASDLVNTLSARELEELFRRWGEEPAAARIARRIVEEREKQKIETTERLARLVEEVKGRSRRPGIHPATLVFQALRIEVNRELVGLDRFLTQLIERLKPGGRLVVISFHSLEDREVKRVFRLEAGKCICFRPREFCTCPRVEKVTILTGKPLRPAQKEVDENPRARSARLRAVEKRR